MADDNKYLESLIDLITFDQKIYETDLAIASEHKAITDIQEKVSALQSKLITDKDKLGKVKQEVKKHELEMKGFDEKEKAKTKQLETVQSDVEYKSIKKEIDFLKQQQHDGEGQLVEIWNRAEQAQKVFDAFETETNKNATELEAGLTTHEEALKMLEQQNKELSTQRRPQEQGIPEDWLEKYNMMRSQNSNPLADVVQDTCSSCFYPLTAQDLLTLKQKKLIQCRECYRFLYRKEETATPKPSA